MFFIVCVSVRVCVCLCNFSMCLLVLVPNMGCVYMCVHDVKICVHIYAWRLEYMYLLSLNFLFLCKAGSECALK